MRGLLIAAGSAVLLSGCGAASDAAPLGAPTDAARAELTPTGSLRVAVAVAPAASAFFSTRDPATQELRGVAVALGAEFAETLGVPVEYVVYPNSGELTAAGPLGEWDVAFMPVDEERARMVDFGNAYNLFESTYMVRGGSPIASIEEVDGPGVRVGVIDNTTTGRSAARQLQVATLVSFRSVDDVLAAVLAEEIDAVGLGRTSLESLAPAVPGARILDGNFHETANAIAVPKDRRAALAHASEFIEAAKASGSVRRALDAVGLEDAVVAPPEPRN